MYINIPIGNVTVSGVAIAYQKKFITFNALVSLGVRDITMLKGVLFGSSYLNPLQFTYVSLFNRSVAHYHQEWLKSIFELDIPLFDKMSYILLLNVHEEVIDNPFFNLRFSVIGVSYSQTFFPSNNIQDQIHSVVIVPGEYDFSFSLSMEKSKMLSSYTHSINYAEFEQTHIQYALNSLQRVFGKILKLYLEVPFLVDESMKVYAVYKEYTFSDLSSICNDHFPSTPTLDQVTKLVEYIKIVGIDEIYIRFKFYYINEKKDNLNLGEAISSKPAIVLDQEFGDILTEINLPNLNNANFIEQFNNAITLYISNLQGSVRGYIIADMNIHHRDFIDNIKNLQEQNRSYNLMVEAYDLYAICTYIDCFSDLNYILWSGFEEYYSYDFVYSFLEKVSMAMNKNIYISSLRITKSLYYDNNHISYTIVNKFLQWHNVRFIEGITLYAWMALHTSHGIHDFTELRTSYDVCYKAYLWNNSSILNDKIVLARSRDILFVYYRDSYPGVFICGFNDVIADQVLNVETLSTQACVLIKRALVIEEGEGLYVYDIEYLLDNYFLLSIDQICMLNQFLFQETVVQNQNVYIYYRICRYVEYKLNNKMDYEARYRSTCRVLKCPYILTATNKFILIFMQRAEIRFSDRRKICKQNVRLSDLRLLDARDAFISMVQYNKNYIYIYLIKEHRVVFGVWQYNFNEKSVYLMSEPVSFEDYVLDILTNSDLEVFEEGMTILSADN